MQLNQSLIYTLCLAANFCNKTFLSQKICKKGRIKDFPLDRIFIQIFLGFFYWNEKFFKYSQYILTVKKTSSPLLFVNTYILMVFFRIYNRICERNKFWRDYHQHYNYQQRRGCSLFNFWTASKIDRRRHQRWRTSQQQLRCIAYNSFS